MKTQLIAVCLFAALGCNIGNAAEEVKMPPMPKPEKAHEWLQKLTGEWEVEVEAFMEPGKPPIKTKGTDTTKAIGGFWTLTEQKGDFLGAPFLGIMTLGYSPEKQKYVGTWVDSMTSTLWQYEGTVDEAGKLLTLEADGPCPTQPGKIVHFRESIEIKDADTKVFTSKMEMDGKWITNMTATSKRKK